MNNQNLMMIKKPQAAGTPEYVEPAQADQGPDFSQYYADAAMMPRGSVPVQPAAPKTAPQAAPEKSFPSGQPVKQAPAKPAATGTGGTERAAVSDLKAKAAKAVQGAVNKNPAPQQKPQQAGAQAPQNKPQQKAPAAPAAGKPIQMAKTPDELCRAYIDAFKASLGLDLSPSICFENMRRFCEADVRNPDKALYFLENTYRVSTVLYLASNLPIIVIASILAEKNRKNILKYVSTEVENGAKPYDELKALRVRRWARKYESMGLNDAPTVTPGLTGISQQLAAAAEASLRDVSVKLKRFNKELTEIVGRFDDAARNDVVYIYSNWWYLLQGFENVPEMRTYVMSITDDTRRNLKV